MTGSNNDAGAGNNNFGYNAFGYKTNVDRIDYSNDTATASPKGKMLHARNSAHAALVVINLLDIGRRANSVFWWTRNN